MPVLTVERIDSTYPERLNSSSEMEEVNLKEQCFECITQGFFLHSATMELCPYTARSVLLNLGTAISMLTMQCIFLTTNLLKTDELMNRSNKVVSWQRAVRFTKDTLYMRHQITPKLNKEKSSQ